MPEVLILTGPPGAGKSTVAQALAERYDRVAHVDVDNLRHLITPTGYAKFGRPEYLRQRHLAIRNACALTRNFVDERFGVIIDDVLDDAGFIGLYEAGLQGMDAAVHLIQLLPSLAACQERHRLRSGGQAPAAWVVQDYERYKAGSSDLPGAMIDSSGLDPYATADKLQALTTSGESLVWQPGE